MLIKTRDRIIDTCKEIVSFRVTDKEKEDFVNFGVSSNDTLTFYPHGEDKEAKEFEKNFNHVPKDKNKKIRPRTVNPWKGFTILENKEEIRDKPKYIFESHLSPGDIVMLTAAIRDLHVCYPKQFITDVDTSFNEAFENNPYLTKLDSNDPTVKKIHLDYDLIHSCNDNAYHFIHGYIHDLNEKLNLNVVCTKFKGDIHISNEEKCWFSQVHEILKKDIPYWVIDSGFKSDYTCKFWEFERFQEVVNRFPQITFVQIGHNKAPEGADPGHIHKPLSGSNVVNLIDKTELRQLIRVIYHSAGVITPVSLPMHLAAAIEAKSTWKNKYRPCIVIAGAREPAVWEAYSNHAYLHNCGKLNCKENDFMEGGCWISRVTPIGDNDEKDQVLCKQPIITKSGQIIPKCLDMITVDDVCRSIREYLEPHNYYQDLEYNEDGTVKEKKKES